MARILLGVTGSVAAIRTPDLFRSLTSAGHDVIIAATEASLYFFDAAQIGPRSHAIDPAFLGQSVYRDRDEWPGTTYQRGAPILHIELRKWADLLVVAPLDANTLAKFALGISDNLLSCIYRSWEVEKAIVLAPAMNTRMWNSPITLRHLKQISADYLGYSLPDTSTLDHIADHLATISTNLVLISPQSKKLACGDIGIGAMAEVATIASIVESWANRPTI